MATGEMSITEVAKPQSQRLAAPVTEESAVEIETVVGMTTLRRRIVMFSLCLALFLSALDITIVATALPTMAQHFHASSAEYAWIGKLLHSRKYSFCLYLG